MIRWSGGKEEGSGLDHRPRLAVSNSAGARPRSIGHRRGVVRGRGGGWGMGSRRVEGGVAANARNRWVSAGGRRNGVCQPARGEVTCYVGRQEHGAEVQELRKGGKIGQCGEMHLMCKIQVDRAFVSAQDET